MQPDFDEIVDGDDAVRDEVAAGRILPVVIAGICAIIFYRFGEIELIDGTVAVDIIIRSGCGCRFVRRDSVHRAESDFFRFIPAGDRQTGYFQGSIFLCRDDLRDDLRSRGGEGSLLPFR